MKILKMVVAVAVLVCGLAELAPPALAQGAYSPGQYQYQSLSIGTNRLVATTNTLSTSNIINLTAAGNVTLEIATELHNTGTSTSAWTFAYSALGSTNLQTIGADSPFTVLLTHTDTTRDVFVTNINVGARGYLVLTTVGQNGTMHLTNTTVRAYTKPGF